MGSLFLTPLSAFRSPRETQPPTVLGNVPSPERLYSVSPGTIAEQETNRAGRTAGCFLNRLWGNYPLWAPQTEKNPCTQGPHLSQTPLWQGPTAKALAQLSLSAWSQVLTHKDTHSHILAYILTKTHTHTQRHMFTETHTYSDTHSYACAHTDTQTHNAFTATARAPGHTSVRRSCRDQPAERWALPALQSRSTQPPRVLLPTQECPGAS